MNVTAWENVLRQAQDERVKGDYFSLDVEIETNTLIFSHNPQILWSTHALCLLNDENFLSFSIHGNG